MIALLTYLKTTHAETSSTYKVYNYIASKVVCQTETYGLDWSATHKFIIIHLYRELRNAEMGVACNGVMFIPNL